MKCYGRLCPPSLESINVPKFVIRAGILPYSNGVFLLGVKQGKYTDFGGGCKGSKLELPFDCAVRELREELGTDMGVDLENITHVFVTGKNKPHQVILMVEVDQLYVPAEIPKEELDGAEIISFNKLLGMNRNKLSDSLKAIMEHLWVALRSSAKRA